MWSTGYSRLSSLLPWGDALWPGISYFSLGFSYCPNITWWTRQAYVYPRSLLALISDGVRAQNSSLENLEGSADIQICIPLRVAFSASHFASGILECSKLLSTPKFCGASLTQCPTYWLSRHAFYRAGFTPHVPLSYPLSRLVLLRCLTSRVINFFPHILPWGFHSFQLHFPEFLLTS